MEIQMLSCYRHKNLVSLVGFCEESKEKILVYEYAKHGSLDKYLSKSDLSWLDRLRVSIDAARALNYLHSDVGPQHRVLHRDIKSSNILLDENCEAKISDFGLSKIGPSNVQFTFLVTNACGIYGYVDPLYVKTGILTKESDVYSFGVVLFEILCGRVACIDRCHDERRFLAPLAQRYYEQNRLDEIIPPVLRDQMKLESLNTFSMVAYQCLKDERSEGQIVDILTYAFELQTRNDRDESEPESDNDTEESDHYTGFAGGNVTLITTKYAWDRKLSEVKRKHKVVIANFSALWCGPSRMIAPYYIELSEKHPSLMFLTVDVDELTDLSTQMDLKATPTFFFLRDGDQFDKRVGANKPELLKMMNGIVDSEGRA